MIDNVTGELLPSNPISQTNAQDIITTIIPYVEIIGWIFIIITCIIIWKMIYKSRKK